MIRYRCPHCAALIVAHERRAGQSSVCKACVKPHPIPADQSLWLNEAGEPLHPPAVVSPAPEPISVAPEPTHTDHQAALAPTAPDIELPESIPEPLAPIPVVVRPPEPAPPVPAPRVTRSAPPVPMHAERPKPQPDADATVATITPPPTPAPPARGRHLPVPVSTPAPRRGRFTPAPVPAPVPRSDAQPPASPYGDPVQLQTQADIAVALTAALTSRMKPPAAPRRDLRPSTAAWLLLTGLGVALVALAVFNDPDYRWAALVAGAVQIVCGYAWIVRLTHMRDPKRGLLCALPPLTLVYLVQYKYAKFRPLRFVGTGALLAGLAVAAPTLHAQTRSLVRKTEPPVAPPDVTAQSKLEQLRVYRERQAYDPLMKMLDLLAKTDPLLSEDAKDRVALSAELKILCQHVDIEVKKRAMAAYARWDPDGARAVCLVAVRSSAEEERKKALDLLPQWKDAESARAVQSLIGRPGTVETNKAKAALEEIGGAPAEQAAIALFNRADDQATKLTALSVLEKVGGADVLEWLRASAMASDDTAVRMRALAAVEAISVRVKVPAP